MNYAMISQQAARLGADRGALIRAMKTLGWAEGLRARQVEVLAPLFSGFDVVAVLPTGAGKSGIYQVPALTRAGLVVVISPLIALMIDQVERLRKIGVSALALHSHKTARENKEALSGLAQGGLSLLYMSPERLFSLDARVFEGVHVQLVAIDEAHCVSEWGHDFRPKYRRIREAVEKLFPDGLPQRIACTATAVPEIVEDIRESVGIREDAPIYRYTPDRPNIFLAVAGARVPLLKLLNLVERPAIVYGSTRKIVEQAALRMKRSDFRAAHYHAGMTSRARGAVQEAFVGGELDVISATCAFGMGVDHGGVRSVIHLEMPSSLEAFLQEFGRGGRDGAPAVSVVRATLDALDRAAHFACVTWPDPETVTIFWERLRPLFVSYKDWLPDGILHMSGREIGAAVGMDPRLCGSCLRIIADAGNIQRTHWQERPAEIVLLGDPARPVRGSERARVMAELRLHADHEGRVRGTVGFFRQSIGMSADVQRGLVERGHIRAKPFGRSQRIVLLDDGPARHDPDLVRAILARSKQRIDASRGYIYTRRCRREWLLDYFGANPDPGRDPMTCCNICKRRGSLP